MVLISIARTGNEMARANARRAGLQDLITFKQGDAAAMETQLRPMR